MSVTKKILVIDDEQGIRDMLSFALQGEGYSVITAADGIEGIMKYTGEKIDAVISDIKMPGLDGLAVLEEIKKVEPGAKVIIATGYGSIETESRILEKGARYINKPFEINVLLETLTKLL
ncbi:MAG: hypothetical protein A2297_09855 [Elusimicrobia bacterium RIFOXYB2_FULL_48_7]|nr:MAG: hypothetical protein A2297_09855 [Elusimicrobia bacterium RIFOXYB2_FULL_48_7]